MGRFYYKIDDNIYSIDLKHINLIPTFKMIHNNNKNECLDPSEALVITTKTIETQHGLRKINDTSIHDLIQSYIDHWAPDLKEENYVAEEPVSTHDVTKILDTYDLYLLKSYSEEVMKNIDTTCMSVIQKKMAEINEMQTLLLTVGNYLGMKGLTNKICAYIATILIDSTIEDLIETSKTTEFHQFFEELQKVAEEEWKDV